MNKGFKVLSSILAMSMVLASGVFAENEPKFSDWEEGTLGVLKGYLTDGRMDVTKKVEVSSVYESFSENEAFKKKLKEYDKAFGALKKDAEIVQNLGDARCDAQFELDSANNELMAGRMLLELAKGLKEVTPEGLMELGDDGLLKPLTLPNLTNRMLFKADAEKLETLVEANKDLQKGYDKVDNLSKDFKAWNEQKKTDLKSALISSNNKKKYPQSFVDSYNAKFEEKINGTDEVDTAVAEKKVDEYFAKVKGEKEQALNKAKDTFAKDEGKLGFGILDGKSKKSKFEDNVKALKDLNDKVGKENYGKAVTKLSNDYGTEYKANTTQGKLTRIAQVAAAKIRMLETFAKEHNFTLRACTLADYTAKVSDKAAKAEDKKNAKKDDVPNTASYFMIYVPTCQLSAPAVKYYGAAQVYDKVLRRPLVCKNVKEEIVKVPMFTFDEITAYDVACCCCK